VEKIFQLVIGFLLRNFKVVAPSTRPEKGFLQQLLSGVSAGN
jgi:hypothetical protein